MPLLALWCIVGNYMSNVNVVRKDSGMNSSRPQTSLILLPTIHQRMDGWTQNFWGMCWTNGSAGIWFHLCRVCITWLVLETRSFSLKPGEISHSEQIKLIDYFSNPISHITAFRRDHCYRAVWDLQLMDFQGKQMRFDCRGWVRSHENM